jgi:NAD(P)-dependent dehydrogenase (short-subunit alcohol dehydrogenase family)
MSGANDVTPTNPTVDDSTFSRASLKGKVAVVTGSTQGLGEATVRLFKERGCAGIIVTGRNKERGEALVTELTESSADGSSCTVHFVQADLNDLDDCRNIIQAADDHFGRLDILVNAAATTERGSIWDTTPDDYDRIMNINARAPFFLMQHAIRIMEREHIAGSIVNISSTASYGSMPMIAAYGMSKGALNVATKNVAYSVAWSRIRVNALAIGWMDTPGEDEIQRRLHTDGKDWKETAEANQPFGRLLKTDEVARCIAFCASEESGMMTGCVIDFDQSVFGAGPQPVPPRKEEWARASGMTFSFPP